VAFISLNADGRLAPVVAAAPRVKARVQGFGGGFIAGGLEEVRGGPTTVGPPRSWVVGGARGGRAGRLGGSLGGTMGSHEEEERRRVTVVRTGK
jgi:hypothetical protein